MTARAGEQRAQSCHFVLARHGLGVAWNGTYGPALAYLDDDRSLVVDRCRYLGVEAAEGAPVPRLSWHEGELRAAFLQQDGPWVTDAEAPNGAPIALVEPDAPSIARALDWATGDSDVRLVVADRRGLVLHRGPHARRFLEQTDIVAPLRAVATAEGLLVVHGVRAAAAVGVVHLDPGGGVRSVRHRLRAPLKSLDLEAVRGKTALALGYGTDRVDVAVLDAAGAMRERPHTVTRRPGHVLAAPLVRWIDNGFCYAVREPGDGHVRVEGFDDQRTPITLQAEPGPFGLAFYRREFVLVQLLPDGDERWRLRLRIAEVDGSGQQVRELSCEPVDAPRRRRTRQARLELRSLRSALVTPTYRDAADLGVEGQVDGLGLTVHDPVGVVRIELTPAAAGTRVTLVASRGDVSQEPPSTSLVRLARWVKGRFSPEARAEAAAALGWAEGVAESVPGATVHRVDRAGDALVLDLDMDTVSAADLRELLDAVRSFVAGSVASGEPA